MKRLGLWIAALLAALVFQGAAPAFSLAQQRATGEWTMTFHDEFSQADGTPPDPTRWEHDIGGRWGNGAEAQFYTDRITNAYIQDGALQITARREYYGGNAYTSARLTTFGVFSQQYGRFEARIRIPTGKGIWPAFWLLGDNIDQAGWPACGEIDIMEHINFEPNVVSTLHFPGASGRDASIGKDYYSPWTNDFSDGFHVYAMEWQPDEIRFYVDGALTQVVRRDNLRPGQQWVFDHPFYIILNVAVGGQWPGYPTARTVFPATMSVDYVRVYTR